MRWQAVASHPPVRRLAEVLRRQWNVWVGFIAPDGAATPAGSTQPVDKPLCGAFGARQDAAGSCSLSLRRWLAALSAGGADGPQLLTCHAGLSALVLPVPAPGGGPSGACYASGFLTAESAERDEQNQLILQRARALDLNPLIIRQGLRSLPRLTERDLLLLSDLCQALADEAAAFLALPASPAPAAPAPSTPPTPASSLPASPIEMVGDSPPMRRLYALIEKVRRSDATVLITGEAGCGKELVARAIHFGSPRRHEAFITQNCSAMSDGLLDSELFGHKKGAFTGATHDKPGLFELAHRGTFFLDEVGDMSPTLQVKLLRVLEEGTFQAVGDTVTRKVDVRIIAATHHDLDALIASGRFRHDLFFRLNVIHLRVPALRERPDDIPALTQHFLRTLCAAHNHPPKALSTAAQAALCAYPWPGNVRELQNEIERLVVLSSDTPHIPDDLLSDRVRAASHAPSPAAPTAPQNPTTMPDAVEQLERQMILHALQATRWNKTHAAARLGVSRRNLIRKVERMALHALRPADLPPDTDPTDPDD